MKPDAAPQSFFIGWDVGGWNCDRNGTSRDAIVILDDKLAVVGTPWRGNLRQCIAASKDTRGWLETLFTTCGAHCPEAATGITMAIDTPLGFPVEFVRLITRQGSVEPHETSGLNCYLFRHTERYLFEHGKAPLSAIKDMIGSQATKGMHVLAKFAQKTESCGVWTDEQAFRVIETYPAACRDTEFVRTCLAGRQSLGHDDKNDARICALIAYLFATAPDSFEQPPADVPSDEGWIWVPRTQG